MAKRPFKKYNSKDSVDAVQLTKQNIEEVRIITRGQIEVHDQTGEPLLLIPSLPSNISADLGDYILDDEGRWKVYLAEDFEEHYKVPKNAEEAEEEE